MRKKTNRIKMLAALSVLTLTASVLLYGCGGGNSDKSSAAKSASQTTDSKTTGSSAKEGGSAVTAVDVTKVADRLKDEIKYDDKLVEPEAETIDILYPGLPQDKIKAKKVYVSSSGGTAEEIAAFEAADEDTAKAVETLLNARIETQKASFKNYVPEELKRLDNAFVVRKGNYVYLSVSADPDKAKSIIEEN
ncbi:MAG: DUF4358 domain-containing protein [Catonella sp.]